MHKRGLKIVAASRQKTLTPPQPSSTLRLCRHTHTLPKRFPLRASVSTDSAATQQQQNHAPHSTHHETSKQKKKNPEFASSSSEHHERHPSKHFKPKFAKKGKATPEDSIDDKGLRIYSDRLGQYMYRSTEKLVDRVDPPLSFERYGWRYTKSLRGEEKRLHDVLQNASRRHDSRGWSTEQESSEMKSTTMKTPPRGAVQQQVASREKEMFEIRDLDEEFAQETEADTTGYPLGTFVETRRNELASHGVVIGETFDTGRLRTILLMSNGEIWKPDMNDIFFTVPALVPVDLAKRCGSEPQTTRPSELHARVEVLRQLRVIERAVEEKYNIVCTKSKLYEQLRHPDPEQWGKTTVSEVARLIERKPTLITIFAVHKYLMENATRFIVQSDYMLSQAFKIVPAAHVKDIETVQEWMRMRENGPLESFAAKAKVIMAESQKMAVEGYLDEPRVIPAQHEWDENDHLILRFLTRALRPWRSTQTNLYAIGQSAILKKLFVGKTTVTDDDLHKALVDLGVLAPWQDIMMLQPDLNLDLDPVGNSAYVKERHALVERGLKRLKEPVSAAQPTGPLGPEDFYPSDPLESLRHDFGNMRVYVVDDVGAHELDDGVSIEKIPSEPGNVWIHVHIADPAATIPPMHALATEARIRKESFYFYDRTFPLFPPSLMHSPKYGLSLGSKRQQGAPERVLTFSCKLDSALNIVDYKIRAGLIRNLKLVDYDTVDRELGYTARRFFPFGRNPAIGDLNKSSNKEITFEKEELQDFKDLLEIANRLASQRCNRNLYAIYETRGLIQGLHNTAPRHIPSKPNYTPLHFSGFPEMEYVMEDIREFDGGSRLIIAEAAKLACRVTSRFALDNGNLPLLRRHVPPFIPVSDEDLQLLMSARDARGFVPSWRAYQHIALNPRGLYTLEPKEHHGMGIPDGEGYVRATSPLRRHSDLVVHWQLHHALLGERAVSRKPPFSAEDLEVYASELTSTEKQRKNLNSNHTQFWQVMFLRRWAEGVQLGKIDPGVVEGGDPLERLEGVTLTNPRLNVQARRLIVDVHVPLIGIHGLLTLNDDGYTIPIGTALKVKVKELQLGVRPKIELALRE